MKEKKETKKKVTNKKDKRSLIVGIAMMVVALGISVGTYAYYQTTITGTISGTILAWDCANGNLTASLSLGSLKPGSSGSGTFTTKATNFKTDVKVLLKKTGNTPANLKFCKDSSCATTISLGTAFPAENAAQFSENGVAKNTTKTFTLYWSWPYGTAGADTPLSTTSNTTFTLDYKIICTQSSTQ